LPLKKNAMTSDIRPLLLDQAKSGVPILALRGETSRVWSEQDYEAEKQTFAEFPNVALETFEGTGHGLPFEKRKEFAERLREFNRSLAH
jgi:pimeloyl-ACP methyl ester carboxylesterase